MESGGEKENKQVYTKRKEEKLYESRKQNHMVGGDGGGSTVTFDGEPGRISLRKQYLNQDLKDQERSTVLSMEKGYQAARTAHRKALRWVELN